MSAVVPPVAPTSYTAAGLAQAQPLKVALTGLGLALSGLLLPFLFVYNPVLLFIDFSWSRFVPTVIAASAGVFSLSVGIIGTFQRRLAKAERLLFFCSGLALVNPLRFIRLASLILFSLLVMQHLLRAHKAGRKGHAQTDSFPGRF